jgi:hypothetical protein
MGALPMGHRLKYHWLAAGWLLLTIGLVACGGRPFDYQPVSEIPKGPAVFSKQPDGHVIYDSEAKKAQEEPPAPDSRISPQEQAEFEEFLEWKKERSQFEAYQQWKALNKDSEEYRQFEQWL